MTGKLTDYQRTFLATMADGPKTIEECKAGRRNIMPTLVRLGLVRSLDFTELSRRNLSRMEVRFELTSTGRSALAQVKP